VGASDTLRGGLAPKSMSDTASAADTISDVTDACFITRRRSYASAVLGVLIQSVCPSAWYTRAMWQNQTMDCEYFDTTRNGNHSNSDWWAMPPFVWNLTHTRSKNLTSTDFRVSRLNRKRQQKSSITTNRKLTTDFPTSYRWSTNVTPNLALSAPKSGPKSDFFVFFYIKFNFSRIKSATKFLCVKTSNGKVVV